MKRYTKEELAQLDAQNGRLLGFIVMLVVATIVGGMAYDNIPFLRSFSDDLVNQGMANGQSFRGAALSSVVTIIGGALAVLGAAAFLFNRSFRRELNDEMRDLQPAWFWAMLAVGGLGLIFLVVKFAKFAWGA